MTILSLKDKAKWSFNSANVGPTIKINKKGYFYSFLDKFGEYEVKILSKNISGNGLFYFKVINEDKKIILNKKIKFTSKSWNETIVKFNLTELHGKSKILITRDLDGIGRIEIGRLVVSLLENKNLNKINFEKQLSRTKLIRCPDSSKVAIIIPYGIYGGAEVYLKNIFEQKPNLLNVDFLFLNKNKLSNYLDNYNCFELSNLNKLKHKLIIESYNKVIFYNSKKVYGFLSKLKENNLINSDLIEIYHSNFKWADSLSSIKSRSNVSKIIRVTDSLCNNIDGNFDLKTIPVSINVDQFTKKESKLKELEKFKKYDLLFGMVARLSPEKNIGYAISLFENLKNYKLVIIGDGPLKERIQTYIENKNIKNIELLGYKENVFEYYNLFDAFLLTSKFEGTPISIIEAMCYNIPIFTTDVGEIRSSFGDLYGLNYLTQNIDKDIDIIKKNSKINNLNLKDYVLNNHNNIINSKIFFREISEDYLAYKEEILSQEILNGEFF